MLFFVMLIIEFLKSPVTRWRSFLIWMGRTGGYFGTIVFAVKRTFLSPGFELGPAQRTPRFASLFWTLIAVDSRKSWYWTPIQSCFSLFGVDLRLLEFRRRPQNFSLPWSEPCSLIQM